MSNNSIETLLELAQALDLGDTLSLRQCKTVFKIAETDKSAPVHFLLCFVRAKSMANIYRNDGYIAHALEQDKIAETNYHALPIGLRW